MSQPLQELHFARPKCDFKELTMGVRTEQVASDDSERQVVFASQEILFAGLSVRLVCEHRPILGLAYKVIVTDTETLTQLDANSLWADQVDAASLVGSDLDHTLLEAIDYSIQTLQQQVTNYANAYYEAIAKRKKQEAEELAANSILETVEAKIVEA